MPPDSSTGFQPCGDGTELRVTQRSEDRIEKRGDALLLFPPVLFNGIARFFISKGQDIGVHLKSIFQKLNGTQYPLNNGAYNALQLIEVE